MKEARLENWFIYEDRLVGNVYGHNAFVDGTEVVTSRVARWDTERKIAITTATKYILGEPKQHEVN